MRRRRFDANPSECEREQTSSNKAVDGFFRLVTSDLRAKAEWNYERSDWTAILKVMATDGTAAMVLYRLMQWARRWRLIPAEFLFNKLNVIVNNCVIGRGAEFGPAFVLIHATGIVINGSVIGGRGVLLEHQVTIGAARRIAPTIGNDVFVGAGAKIIGGVRVGDRARIGANAVVVRDVPSDSTAVGIPARVVRERLNTTTDIERVAARA